MSFMISIRWIPASAGMTRWWFAHLSLYLHLSDMGHPSMGHTSAMKTAKSYFVYILASKQNGTLYTGVTSNLTARVWQHKNNIAEGFTQKYQVHRLVYFEEHQAPNDAILREKQIKKWNRDWKIRLIEEKNPEWKDLWDDVSVF